MFEELDELARGLGENDISRRQAIKWAGYSVLGATLSSMGFAESAEALTRRGRRRCLKRHGMVCGTGTLRDKYCCQKGTTCAGGKTCAPKCPGGGSCGAQGFPECGNDPDCFCTNTVEGGTFCARSIDCGTATTCTNSQQCPTGHVCADTCCNGQPICNPPCVAL